MYHRSLPDDEVYQEMRTCSALYSDSSIVEEEERRWEREASWETAASYPWSLQTAEGAEEVTRGRDVREAAPWSDPHTCPELVEGPLVQRPWGRLSVVPSFWLSCSPLEQAEPH